MDGAQRPIAPGEARVVAADAHLVENAPVAQQIATTLGETEPVPLLHLRRIVQTLGPEGVLPRLAKAQAVEARGGLGLLDGSRWRTSGGVFFRLVGKQTTLAERNRIWPRTKKAKSRPSSNEAEPTI